MPEFLTANKALQPKAIRLLDAGWAVDGSSGSSWTHRQRVTHFDYGATWDPNYWTTTTCSGTATICGTDTYTAAAAPSTPGTMTDSEVWRRQFLNANATTTPTLNVGGRGAFPIYGVFARLQNATLGGSPTTSDVRNFTFTETDGMSTCIPAGAHTFSYTVKSSDTTLNTLGSSIQTSSEADATLIGANIFLAMRATAANLTSPITRTAAGELHSVIA